VEAAGLVFDVVESVPVHEDIKLGLPTRDRYIENYCKTLKRLGEAGVRCVWTVHVPMLPDIQFSKYRNRG
jgi:mannonate dehydratase